MKGTIQSITGQESGFLLYQTGTGAEAILDNWASNLEEYEYEEGNFIKIESCLEYLEWFAGRDYDGELQYVQYANPVTEDDLRVPGLLYKVEGFLILAPEGWN
jgi:hypothetical protein